jgi:hypothetical protein
MPFSLTLMTMSAAQQRADRLQAVHQGLNPSGFYFCQGFKILEDTVQLNDPFSALIRTEAQPGQVSNMRNRLIHNLHVRSSVNHMVTAGYRPGSSTI